MASTVPGLAAAGPLTGSELLYLVQAAVDKKLDLATLQLFIQSLNGVWNVVASNAPAVPVGLTVTRLSFPTEAAVITGNTATQVLDGLGLAMAFSFLEQLADSGTQWFAFLPDYTEVNGAASAMATVAISPDLVGLLNYTAAGVSFYYAAGGLQCFAQPGATLSVIDEEYTENQPLLIVVHGETGVVDVTTPNGTWPAVATVPVGSNVYGVAALYSITSVTHTLRYTWSTDASLDGSLTIPPGAQPLAGPAQTTLPEGAADNQRWLISGDGAYLGFDLYHGDVVQFQDSLQQLVITPCDVHINALIDVEKDRALAAEAALTAELNTEIARAETSENAIATNLADEVGRATAAEGVIATNAAAALAAEQARAVGVEGGLTSTKGYTTIIMLDASRAVSGADITTSGETVFRAASADAIALTLPLNATVSIPVGSKVGLVWEGAGQPSFVADDGVTFTGNPSPVLANAQGSMLLALKIDTDTWWVGGDVS